MANILKKRRLKNHSTPNQTKSAFRRIEDLIIKSKQDLRHEPPKKESKRMQLTASLLTTFTYTNAIQYEIIYIYVFYQALLLRFSKNTLAIDSKLMKILGYSRKKVDICSWNYNYYLIKTILSLMKRRYSYSLRQILPVIGGLMLTFQAGIFATPADAAPADGSPVKEHHRHRSGAR